MQNIIEFLDNFFYGTARQAEVTLIDIIKKMDPENKRLDLNNEAGDIDDIYVRLFNFDKGCWEDRQLLAIRVDKGEYGEDELRLCVVDPIGGEVAKAEGRLDEVLDKDSDYWLSVNDDKVEYVPTMFNIITGIEMYIPEEFIPKNIDEEAMAAMCKEAQENADVKEDEDFFEDSMSKMAVVSVNNADAGRKYELLVMTENKDDVINELLCGKFFVDDSDAEFATLYKEPEDEAINLLSDKCIDLSGRSFCNPQFGDRCIDGLLSSTPIEQHEQEIISRLDRINVIEPIEFHNVFLMNGLRVISWGKSKESGGVVVVAGGEKGTRMNVSDLRKSDKCIIFAEVLNALYKKQKIFHFFLKKFAQLKNLLYLCRKIRN